MLDPAHHRLHRNLARWCTLRPSLFTPHFVCPESQACQVTLISGRSSGRVGRRSVCDRRATAVSSWVEFVHRAVALLIPWPESGSLRTPIRSHRSLD